MTTIVEIDHSDPKPNKLTLEIADALREVKLVQEGKLQPLFLDDIDD